MKSEFFVPFNMIQFLSSKEGQGKGNFKHTTAARIYLYLLFAKSGRIHKNELSELVSFFGSSKQNIKKALIQLQEWNLLTLEGRSSDVYQVRGKRMFTVMYPQYSNTRSYLFTLDNLKNLKVFKALLFKYSAQDVAMRKGEAFDNNSKVKKTSEGNLYTTKFNKSNNQTFVNDPTAENGERGFQIQLPGISVEQSIKTSMNISGQNVNFKNDYLDDNGCINYHNGRNFDVTINNYRQTQSLSYLGKAIDRSPRTISNKLNLLKKVSKLESLDVKVKSGKTKVVSTLHLEHLNKVKPEAQYSLLQSTCKIDIMEKFNRAKSTLPILSEYNFITVLDGKYSVVNRAPNFISYFNTDKNCKVNRIFFDKAKFERKASKLGILHGEIKKDVSVNFSKDLSLDLGSLPY
jgi:hypothetical protein